MPSISKFLKQNKKVKENVKYKVSEAFTDENGEVLEWELKHITARENQELQEDASYEVPVKGKPGMTSTKLNAQKYVHSLLVKSVVFPDLYDKDLQDSYGVMTPEDLLYAMIDDAGEYTRFSAYVQEINGFNKGLAEKVEDAKN